MRLESLERGTSLLRTSFGDVFTLLMAAVSLLVVIVALNVAGLLLARAVTRQQEMAVRLAIGGTPLRLVKQMVSESMTPAFQMSASYEFRTRCIATPPGRAA